MKKLLCLTLFLAGLSAFVYFYEIEGEEKREEARELEESLLRLEEDQITGLRIVKEDSPVIALNRDGDEWKLRKPLETSADQDTVGSLLRNLLDARRARTFEEGGKSAAEYGLESPEARLTIETQELTKELLVGDKDFTGNELYVMFEGDPEVFLTSGLILTSIEKELIDWRDKSVLTFDRDKLREIRIQRASEEIVLMNSDDQWLLKEPVDEPADDGTVSGLLSTLTTGEAKEFIVENVDNLEVYGLDRPTLSVRIREEAEESWQQLDLGSEYEDQIYARNLSKSAVFTVEKDLLKDLFQDVWEFRSKEVVNVTQDEIATLTVDRKGSLITVRREDYKWILEAPEEVKEKEVLAYKFWYPIDDIEFESISDGSEDFPESEIEMIITLKDGSTRSFQFAAQGEEYLARQVESGRFGRISKEDFEKLDFKLEDITD
jgi:hypothetical protein